MEILYSMDEMKKMIKISDREYVIGESSVKLLDDHIIRVNIIGTQTTDIAYELYNATRELEKLVEGKVSYLIDLNRAGRNSPEASRLWKSATEEKNVHKVAQFGLHPVAQVLAAFVNNMTTANQHIRFFRTMEDALQWIRE